MEVKVSFDTEKESITDLKKFISYVQGIIERREGNSNSTQNVQVSQQQVSRPVEQPRPQTSGQTAGGARVIPYEDMSAKLSSILMGRGA